MSHLVIVEDHGLIAHTLAAALRRRGATVTVVDPAEDPEADLAGAVVGMDPDLVLLDLDLGHGRDGVDLLPDLVGSTSVLVVSGVSDPVRLARCVAAGAVGLLTKSASFDEMTAAIERTLSAGTLLTKYERDEHLALLRKHEAEKRDRLAAFERLTPREAEVLGELVRGLSVDEIARSFVVSVATVRTQVRAILGKLDVGSQLAAIAAVREAGWIPPQER